METLEELKILIKAASQKLSDAHREVADIQLRINIVRRDKWLADNNCSIGDDFILKGEHKGKLTGFDYNFNTPKPIFTLYRKDGSLGNMQLEHCSVYTKV